MREDFTVQLDQVFKGPMDLLLHLVREQEVEIHEIKISRVIERYFQYLQELEQLDIEIAGDFLVMAATLMAIKSRSLLPREEVEIEDDLDPQDELIQRLIEYRRFKGVSDDLDERYQERAQQHPRGFRGEVKQNAPEKTLNLGELTAWDLLSTFSRLMRETLANRPHRISTDSRPLRWYVKRLGHAIHERRSFSLRAFLEDFEEGVSKDAMIGTFCALLELIKIGIAGVVQEKQTDDITVVLRDDVGEDFDSVIGASTFMDEEDEDGTALGGLGEGSADAEAPQAAEDVVAQQESPPAASEEEPPGADGASAAAGEPAPDEAIVESAPESVIGNG